MGRVLVVDDGAGWRGLYRLVLSEAHEVFEGGHALEALEVLRRHPFDLVVLDYELPGMSGAQLLATMRAEGIAVPVVLCTAHAGLVRARDYDAVLSKSTDLRLLRRTIEATLE
ncbi:MAG: response regulator, partial [Candidatus Rokuibacteriota bacterium]